MESNCVILVRSCDKYKDAWEPFFRLFYLYWPKCPFKIYLITESIEYINNLGITTLCGGEGKTWSELTIWALKQLKSEIVLFFLEDFFLMSLVNPELVFKGLETMLNNKDIGVISFNPDIQLKKLHYWKLEGQYDDDFYILGKESQYRVNAQANLWNRNFFLSLLRKPENAWEFEVYGTMRAKRSKRIFLWHPPDDLLVFDYKIDEKFGYGIKQGKWLPRNKELFEEHDIHVNFENLGWTDVSEHRAKSPRRKRTNFELIKLFFINPKELYSIVSTKTKQKIKVIRAWF